MTILGRVETVDRQMDKVTSLIERSGREDPELAAGLAAGSLTRTQSAIDKAAVAVEDLDAHLREVARTRAS